MSTKVFFLTYSLFKYNIKRFCNSTGENLMNFVPVIGRIKFHRIISILLSVTYIYFFSWYLSLFISLNLNSANERCILLLAGLSLFVSLIFRRESCYVQEILPVETYLLRLSRCYVKFIFNTIMFGPSIYLILSFASKNSHLLSLCFFSLLLVFIITIFQSILEICYKLSSRAFSILWTIFCFCLVSAIFVILADEKNIWVSHPGIMESVFYYNPIGIVVSLLSLKIVSMEFAVKGIALFVEMLFLLGVWEKIASMEISEKEVVVLPDVKKSDMYRSFLISYADKFSFLHPVQRLMLKRYIDMLLSPMGMLVFLLYFFALAYMLPLTVTSEFIFTWTYFVILLSPIASVSLNFDLWQISVFSEKSDKLYLKRLGFNLVLYFMLICPLIFKIIIESSNIFSPEIYIKIISFLFIVIVTVLSFCLHILPESKSFRWGAFFSTTHYIGNLILFCFLAGSWGHNSVLLYLFCFLAAYAVLLYNLVKSYIPKMCES